MASKIKQYFNLLKQAGSEFSDDNATKLAASLAYSTIFAIGPLLLVIITISSIFFSKDDISGHVTAQLQGLVGTGGAKEITDIMGSLQKQSNKSLYGIVGAIILVFSATAVFVEIQGSINYIWSIKAKPKKGWLKLITDRLLSFSLIIGVGFLLIVSLLINTLMDLLTEGLKHFFGDADVVLFQVVNVALLFSIISFLFAVIYKVLPDARIHWKDALVGASFTGVLFLIGKFGIGLYLGNSSMTATYGAAASIIVLLSWVYYTSLILYFGAEFTKVYALNLGGGIEAYKTAVFIVKREEKEMPRLQQTPEQKEQPKDIKQPDDKS